MALLKDLIVQGASRFIGDAYFATIKAGVWNGTPIDLSHGGTAGETTAGKILTSTTTSGTSAWLSIILGNCMTISTTNSNITVGVSDTYKSIMDYYARTAYYSSGISISPTTYDKGASSVSVTVTMTPYKEGAAYTTTSSDSASYGTSSSLGTSMTRNTSNFTATYTFTPDGSSGNKTIYGRINIGGVNLTTKSATLTCTQKVYYGKAATTNLSDLNFSNLSSTPATSKGSEVIAPAGDGVTEYWWFATPFVNNNNGIMWNTTTNETAGCEYKGSVSMNNSTYHVWCTISVAATLSQGWKIGK